MIKGLLSGKLLKQLFIIGLISCFILLGNSFASAGYTRQLNNYGYNPYNQSFDIQLNRSGLPLTQSLGYTKPLFFFIDSGTYGTKGFWWWYNGLPYIVHYEGSYSFSSQGNITFYSVCSEISSLENTSLPGNCTTVNVSSDTPQILGNFVSSLTSSDYYYFERGEASRNNYINFCISNHSVGNSFCFGDSMQNGRLTGSLGLDLSSISFDSIDSSILQNPPRSNGDGGDIGIGEGGLDGNTSGTVNNTITGDYVYSNCTYQQIFDYIESFGYNEYVCYGGLDNFNLYDSSVSYNPIPLSGKTLGQILSYSNARDSPNDWFTFWNGLYVDRYNQNFNSMWESYPAVYRTWFDLYYRYGGGNLIFDTVREYCSMKQLDIDFNTTKYKGQYFKVACDSVKNGNQYGYDSGDSQNVDGVNWIGVGNMGSSSGSSISNNPTVFIQNFFNELKANLPTRYDLGGGFLPIYIITFMCAIILFRFLSH